MTNEKLTKMTGYLEKRGKLSILGRWKKWWCVLEGQLLLYYKSRLDYANLSPCCGSLNMALVRNVQPNIGYQIHIITHTQLIILRTKDKEKQQQWFHALVGVLPQNSYLSPFFHFPTHSIEYRRRSDHKKRKDKRKSFTELTSPQSSEEQCTFSDTPESEIITETQTFSSQEQTQIRAENINVSRFLECSVARNELTLSSIKYSSEINIRRYSSYHSVNAASLQSEETTNRRSISCECIFSDYRIASMERYEFQRILSTRSDQTTPDDGQQCVINSVPPVISDSNKISTCRRDTLRRKFGKGSKKNATFGKRSFSFLKKIFKKKRKNFVDFSESNFNGNSNDEMRINFNEAKEKIEENPLTIVDIEKNTSDSSISNLEERISIKTIENVESTTDEIENITICNNFDEEKTTSIQCEIEENLISESEIESLQIDSENEMIDSLQVEERLPDLPVKNGSRLSHVYHEDRINSTAHETNDFNDEICHTESMSIDTCKNVDLDSLLLQLTALNNECDKSYQSLEFNNNVIEDPDYDIPRPHKSLISETDSDASTSDKNHLNHSNNNNISVQKHNDSLSIDMAPDSLEMPWLLNDNTCNVNYWTTKREFNLCLENDSGSEYDYHDSLDSDNKYCLR